jgi:hypothetical protein
MAEPSACDGHEASSASMGWRRPPPGLRLARARRSSRSPPTPLPRSALFLAGKAFQSYRAAGGSRTGVSPDFFIGAHAAVSGWRLLSRQASRYRSYFPTVDCVIQTIVGAYFRASWAAISEERGQSFHAIVGALGTE